MVKDHNGNAVAQASVTVTVKDSDDILGFFITKSDGKFQISLADNQSHDLLLSVQKLNFEVYSKEFNSAAENLEIVLENDEPIQIEEVKLKSTPIRQKGDTLVYDVSNFKSIEDRSIADVIKKMPGI